MSTAHVRLRKLDRGDTWVELELTLQRAAALAIRTKLGEATQELSTPGGDLHPSHAAAEGAVYSGALFALRKIADPESGEPAPYELTVNRVRGMLPTWDLEGFAHAAVVAVARITQHEEILTEETMLGWQVEQCVIAP